MEISQKNFIIAWENKKLIHGALKYAHVRQDYVHYEDLYQNAVLLYAEMLETNPEMDREKLDKLAFRKIIWRTLNELHKIKLQSERWAAEEDAMELTEENNLDDLIVLKDELEQMEELERAIFLENIIFHKKMSEVKEEYDVCRVTLQRRKRKLLKELREVLK